MSRHANVEKAGYFPLPETITPLIASFISAPHGGRIYDPCTGEGTALSTLSLMLHLEPYGVELQDNRAFLAKKLIRMAVRHDSPDPIAPENRVLHLSYEFVSSTPEMFNLVYCNPPYMFADEMNDKEMEFGRDEYKWMVGTRKNLQPDGLFVWVVPQHMLLHRNSLTYLASWYDNIQAYRFPDEEYAQFHQVVVFATLRQAKQMPDEEEVERLRTYGRLGSKLDILTAQAEPVYVLPPLAVPPDQVKFRSAIVSPEEAIAEAASAGVAATEEFAIHLRPRSTQSHRLKPLTPMKKGHLVSIVAAGLLNGAVLEKDGQRLMLKGQSYKTWVSAEKVEPKEDGGRTVTNTYTERVMTRITVLAEDGLVQELTGPALESFLSRWVETLTAKVIEDYPPLYRFNLNGYGPILKHLNPYRNIPRVNKPGLLPAQAHAAAAAAMRLERANDAYIIGEMGTGKTVMGTAVPAILHAKSKGKKMNHIIIMCPPHLIHKWEREVKHVWPAARTMLLKTISDVDKFFAAPGPIFGVMKETSGRISTGWNHTFHFCGEVTTRQRARTDKVEVVRKPHFQAGEIVTEKPLLLRKLDEINDYYQSRQRPQSGSLPQKMKRMENRAFTLEKVKEYRARRGLRCPHCGELITANKIPTTTTEHFHQKQQPCESCGRALYQMERRDSDPKAHTGSSFAAYVRREKQIRRGQTPKPEENIGYARWGLANYINRHYKGRLDLLIADEMHQFKGADSDRGYAYHRLCTAADKVLGLTGTLYGGKASTLFYLLYRSSSLIRRHFTKTEEEGLSRLNVGKWVSQYGILQEIETRHEDENGKTTGNSKNSVRTKELPGGSPAMLPWILESCVFVSLPDMGFALPDYQEIPRVVEMSWAQADQYREFEEQLRQEMVKRIVMGDKSLLGAYINSTITLPDSPWRNKGVFDRQGRGVAFAPALPDTILYPKEEEIIELIEEKVQAGQKVLLLCQQTATLDITPHWTARLRERGLRTAVLNAPPDKREAWIEAQLRAGLDVLITHPRKVETGLDLLQFPTIIWMGTEFSLYTIQQASRRSWRIGQANDVEVYFFVYGRTVQEKAMGLIASKVGAAARINGDVIAEEGGLGEFDEYANTDLVAALTNMLEKEIQAVASDENMKQVNEAYELAQAGNFATYAHTPFSFAGCQSEAEIKKRYRELARLYHPDAAKQQTEKPAKSQMENLADLFQQANRVFHEDEEVMGEFSGPLLPIDDSLSHLDSAAAAEWDTLIRKLILGEKETPFEQFTNVTHRPDNPPGQSRPSSSNGAYHEPGDDEFIHLPGVGRIPASERHNYRLVFGNSYVRVDVPEPAPTGTAVPLSHDEAAVCTTPGTLEMAAVVDGRIVVDPMVYNQMRDALQTSRRIDTIFTVIGKSLVVVSRTPELKSKNLPETLIAYEIDLACDHLELLTRKPTWEEKRQFGSQHGQAVLYRGSKYALVGPELVIVPEGYMEPETARKPKTQPVEVKTTRPSRLVFGVHAADGRTRENGLDKVAVQQLGQLN
ncbi:MAG: hypothetical protein KF770_22975 [Anaerolineae bacterium]|nr:hypothetical protein [Anaerolineae bacterium]